MQKHIRDCGARLEGRRRRLPGFADFVQTAEFGFEARAGNRVQGRSGLGRSGSSAYCGMFNRGAFCFLRALPLQQSSEVLAVWIVAAYLRGPRAIDKFLIDQRPSLSR